MIRFEIKLGKHTAFVTGKANYVKNAYIQPRELKHRKHLLVTHGAYVYRSNHYTKRNRIEFIHKGEKLRIKRAKFIASKDMTRLQLINGNWFTANKNFGKLVK